MEQLHGALVNSPTIGPRGDEIVGRCAALETDGAPVSALTRLYHPEESGWIGLPLMHARGVPTFLSTLFTFGHEGTMCPETPSGMAFLVSRDLFNGYRDDQSRNASTAAPTRLTGAGGDSSCAASVLVGLMKIGATPNFYNT